eukprot:scaffold17515_cov30-Tisochrysis_lutea.AAC.3
MASTTAKFGGLKKEWSQLTPSRLRRELNHGSSQASDVGSRPSNASDQLASASVWASTGPLQTPLQTGKAIVGRAYSREMARKMWVALHASS